MKNFEDYKYYSWYLQHRFKVGKILKHYGESKYFGYFDVKQKTVYSNVEALGSISTSSIQEEDLFKTLDEALRNIFLDIFNEV